MRAIDRDLDSIIDPMFEIILISYLTCPEGCAWVWGLGTIILLKLIGRFGAVRINQESIVRQMLIVWLRKTEKQTKCVYLFCICAIIQAIYLFE